MPAVLNVNTNERIITGTPSIYILGNQCQKLELLDKNPWRNKLSTLATSFQLLNAIHHNDTTNSAKLEVVVERAQDKGDRKKLDLVVFAVYICTSCMDPHRVKSPAWMNTSPGGTSI